MEGNLTDSPLLNIQFCEGKYGGLALGGVRPLGIHMPEHLNAATGAAISWCGIHMLLFNRHDDMTLKVIAAYFVLNGAASFLYHFTGYDSALAIDGFTMMNAVWLTTGFVLEELTSHMVDGPMPWDGVCHKGFVLRRCFRTTYWVGVTCVPALFLLALERPWRAWVGNISPWFIGAFIAPLVLMLSVNVILMLFGVEDFSFNHFPSVALGERTFSAARSRFFWGLTLVLLGVGAWLLSEGLCDQLDFFKLFPGHAIFHVLMALGLMNCLVYPATLRARTYGAHARFPSTSIDARSRPLSCRRLLTECLAASYFFVFPAIIFVRHRAPLTSRSSADSELEEGRADAPVTPHKASPKPLVRAAAPTPSTSLTSREQLSPLASAAAATTPEAQRIKELEARMQAMEQQQQQDSHLWPASSQQRAFSARSDAQPIRDGLIVAHSSEVFTALLADLSKFAEGGGTFALHVGDVGCGGASFRASGSEFESQLRAVAAAERAALPRGWPIHHVPGNHDLHPEVGGLASWAAVMGNSSGGGIGGFARDGAGAYYRAIRLSGWRLLLLDSASAVRMDTDGHGRVGGEQLHWLEHQLHQAKSADEDVILIIHQLLVPPTDASGAVHRWFVPQYDLVENAAEVLSVIRQHAPRVQLSLSGHVHANSLTTRHGVPFVTTSSASEYPMMWREVIVRRCAIELRTHSLDLPDLRDKSAKRDTRGVNDAKLGGVAENHVVLRNRGGACGRREAASS